MHIKISTSPGNTKEENKILIGMKKKIIFSLFLICFSVTSFSQFKLDIEISGIRNEKGNLMLQLFDSTENVLNQEMSPIKENKASFSFPDLKPGKYAVRYYHDENLNGKMDANMFGKPTEGYGFSNNVTGKSGPPPFEKWLFEVTADKKIELKPTY
jgi:uncharacterized protein (DUF2141 family)